MLEHYEEEKYYLQDGDVICLIKKNGRKEILFINEKPQTELLQAYDSKLKGYTIPYTRIAYIKPWGKLWYKVLELKQDPKGNIYYELEIVYNKEEIFSLVTLID